MGIMGIWGGLASEILMVPCGFQFSGLSDVSISADIPVEGEITVPVSSPSHDEEFSTLDEPVKDTIVRNTPPHPVFK